MLRCSRLVGAMIGFFLFFIYSGLIHAFFWVPLVLPRHGRTDSPSFLSHYFPVLCLVSAVWIGLYEFHSEAVALICISHSLMDVWMAISIGLQLPLPMKSHHN